MQKTFNKRIIFITAIAAIGIGAAWWMRNDAPQSQPEPAPVTKKHPRSASPGLNTGFVPPPLPSNTQPGGTIRPALVSMLDPSTPIAKRIEILDEINPDLSEAEVISLLHELNNIPTDERVSAWHSTYIHNICNLLQRVDSYRDAFSHALAAVAANRDLPVVYRDYAFQHLRILWHRSRNDESSSVGQARASAIEDAFRNLLHQRPETAAQSLLGLHEIRHTSGGPVVADEEITRLVNGILSAPPAPDSVSARMTAVRILAERRIPGNSRMLRDIAMSEAEHSLVRASAVAALGFIADPADLEFLASLPSNDPVIAGALRHAGTRQ
jgi:hypothetical protein